MKGLTSALGLGMILLIIAVIGKLIGNGVLCLKISSWMSTALISISMVPRAEIAMVVMQKGYKLGGWAVTDELFSAMVLVSLGTCILSPIILRVLLKRISRGNRQD